MKNVDSTLTKKKNVDERLGTAWESYVCTVQMRDDGKAERERERERKRERAVRPNESVTRVGPSTNID